MSNKVNKKLRKLAAQLTTEQNKYLRTVTTKTTHDFNGKMIPYKVEQVALHPKSPKYVNKILKSIPDLDTLSFEETKVLVESEVAARLSDLLVKGYK